jgi:hypothetical protein
LTGGQSGCPAVERWIGAAVDSKELRVGDWIHSGRPSEIRLIEDLQNDLRVWGYEAAVVTGSDDGQHLHAGRQHIDNVLSVRGVIAGSQADAVQPGRE